MKPAQLSLSQWAAAARLRPQYNRDTTVSVPISAGQRGYRELWDLSDYHVTSVIGGSVWLRPKWDIRAIDFQRCALCGGAIHRPDNGYTTGYGVDSLDRKICWPCCGIQDKRSMIQTGRTTLYLVSRPDGHYAVTNWPDSLSFKAYNVRVGHHNIARTRTDVHFNGPDGFVWRAVQYGDHSQIAHCRRTREHV